jgi:uncharacterized protein YqhQ
MDLNKIFLKDACPTSIGGQAVMDGVMMRGVDRMAIAVRTAGGDIHIKTEPVKRPGKWAKIPIIRGVKAFVDSLVIGMKTILYSADALEHYEGDEDAEEAGRFYTWIEERFGKKAAWNFAVYSAVIIALIMAIGIFILFPTFAVSALGRVTGNVVVLNLVEGIFRIILFLLYIKLVSRTDEIHKIFQYHGAEHNTIHCFENGKPLTPENAQKFYTLHPRCGTSFLMFVMVISLIVFSLLGWPNLAARLLSRIILIPVVAGLSYELLKWAGRSDGKLVRALSMPGILLQKLTTAEPSDDQLEVAIASVKAVLVPEGTPFIEGICDVDGNLIEEIKI